MNVRAHMLEELNAALVLVTFPVYRNKFRRRGAALRSVRRTNVRAESVDQS